MLPPRLRSSNEPPPTAGEGTTASFSRPLSPAILLPFFFTGRLKGTVVPNTFS